MSYWIAEYLKILKERKHLESFKAKAVKAKKDGGANGKKNKKDRIKEIAKKACSPKSWFHFD